MYKKKFNSKTLFNNSVKIHTKMAELGIAPPILEAKYPYLTTKLIVKKEITDYKNFIKNVNKLIDKMHIEGYCHGDLHLGNIVNDEDDRVFFIDFDHSFSIKNGRKDSNVLKWMSNFDGIESYDDFINYDYLNFLEEIVDLL